IILVFGTVVPTPALTLLAEKIACSISVIRVLPWVSREAGGRILEAVGTPSVRWTTRSNFSLATWSSPWSQLVKPVLFRGAGSSPLVNLGSSSAPLALVGVLPIFDLAGEA